MDRLVPAVSRAFDILELFLDVDGALTAPEIVRALGLPRTTVHELVSTLLVRGYLATDRSGGYRLGVRVHQLGSRYAERLDLATEGGHVAREVAGSCGESVHVAILEDTHVIYIAKADSTHAVRMVSAAGRRLPAHCTAVGKLLLAHLPEEELYRRVPRESALAAMTPDSITEPAVLYAQLTHVREHGTAVEECESNLDVSCVAAPVRDAAGNVVAALSISVPTIRWAKRRRDEWERLVTTGAHDLSARLGHQRIGHQRIGHQRT